MSWAVEVQCSGDASRGWTCFAAVRSGDTLVSEHEIRVTPGDLARLAPDAGDPAALVERSMAFLLDREAPGSILRTFELTVIGRFFPEYEATIRRDPV
jgi:hypothetical protein